MDDPPFALRTPEYYAAYDKWQAKWNDRIEQFYQQPLSESDEVAWRREYNQDRPYVCPHCLRVVPVKKIKHIDRFYSLTLTRVASDIRCTWGCAKCVRALEDRLRRQFVRKCFYCHNAYLIFQSGLDYICHDCLTEEIKREAALVLTHNNRARNINEEDSLNILEWMQTLRDFKYHCAYCKTGPYECLEHFVPLGHGRGTTVNNCVPACQRCNVNKKNHHPLKDAKMLWGMDIAGVERYLRKRKRVRDH